MSRRGKRTPNLGTYAGKWIALLNNQVVGVGASLPELMRRVSTRSSRLKPSVFLVPRRDEGPYVLVMLLPVC